MPGREFAQEHLQWPLGIRVQRCDRVGKRIFVDGNSAAALGCVYGGATVAAWYPITPSSSVAEAFQRVLTNIFHRRIDYPGFDFNAPPRRERRGAEAARAS